MRKEKISILRWKKKIFRNNDEKHSLTYAYDPGAKLQKFSEQQCFTDGRLIFAVLSQDFMLQNINAPQHGNLKYQLVDIVSKPMQVYSWLSNGENPASEKVMDW